MRDPSPNFENLLEVLNFRTKRDLTRYSKNLVVYQQDLVVLILAARHGELAPYRYANHFEKFLPSNLFPNDEECQAITENGAGEFKTRGARKFASKIFQLAKEQRALAAHLLYTPNHQYWHLFYFDNRDKSTINNHWKHGAHIHYLSDLWPELSLAEVWRRVQKGEITFANKLHLRYRK